MEQKVGKFNRVEQLKQGLRPLLHLLSRLYGWGVRLRHYGYERGILSSSGSKLPVICVGNVVVGGSGKSPFTSYLAARLHEQGRRPVILSRGYKGRYRTAHLVSDSDTAEDVGDEPLMHAAAFGGEVPVVVSPKRILGVKLIEEQSLGDVTILDDGFQHLALARDLNILLLDISSVEAIERWLNGKLLPAGMLREELSSALKRANAVVFVERGACADEKVSALVDEFRKKDSIPNFVFRLLPWHFVDVFSGESQTLVDFAGRKVTAISGIANPGSFFSMLEFAGLELIERFAFPDHYYFSQVDYKRAISGKGIPVVTTAKDAVKLAAYVKRQGELYVLALRGDFTTEDEEKEFWEILRVAVGTRDTGCQK